MKAQPHFSNSYIFIQLFLPSISTVLWRFFHLPRGCASSPSATERFLIVGSTKNNTELDKAVLY